MKDKVCVISCTKEEFDRIKSDERFVGLLNLARFINALRFCQKPMLETEDSSHTSIDGTIINSFLFASSLLFEGFKLVENLDKSLKCLESYKNGFKSLIEDQYVINFRKSILHKVRNKIVFHFDGRVIKKSLKSFDVPTIKLASRYDNCAGGLYFGLADEIVIHYLLPRENESDSYLKDKFYNIVQDTCTIMDKFNKSAIILMAEVMEDIAFFKKTE